MINVTASAWNYARARALFSFLVTSSLKTQRKKENVRRKYERKKEKSCSYEKYLLDECPGAWWVAIPRRVFFSSAAAEAAAAEK